MFFTLLFSLLLCFLEDAPETLANSSSASEKDTSNMNTINEGEGEDDMLFQSSHLENNAVASLSGIDNREAYVDEAETFGDPTSTPFSIQKMACLLRTGSEPQQTVVLFEMQQRLKHCFEETVDELVPVLCECMPLRSEELQLSASEVFADIVQSPRSPKITKMITVMAFRIIQATRSEDSFEVWGEILVIVLPDVKWTSNMEVENVLRIVDRFSKRRNESCRKIAARILGSLSESIEIEEVRHAVMARAMNMLDDADVEVRGMVAESFSFIGAGLDLQCTEKTLWPKLLALMHDPDARIHAASLRSIAHILEVKRIEIRKSAFLKKLLSPWFAKECFFTRKAASEDQRSVDDDSYLLLEIMSEVFGPLLYTLHPFLSEDIRKDAFKAFQAMSTCNGPIVRRYCAFNLPGVALSFHGPLRAELAGIAEFLARDSDSETRWNLAAGLHKTCSILMDKHSAHTLHKAVMVLLQDENPLVRTNVLENLSELVRALQLTSDAEKWTAPPVSSFFKNLKLLSEGNWRTQELLAKQLKEVCKLVPHHSLKEDILPLLYQMAEEGAHCVRKETMAAIAKAIWCIPIPEEREEVLTKFFQEWGQGGVYWMRIAFLDCAQVALKIFSNDLFAYLFLPHIYQLARDNVSNVRLRVARMLHELAPLNLHNEEFQKTLSWFMDDIDPDIRSTMADMDVKMEGELKKSRIRRKENEAREEEEAKLEEEAILARADLRRKGTKAKMRASAILPKLAIRAGQLSPRHGRPTPPSLSPLSGPSHSPSPQSSPSKLSSMLSGSSSRSKDSGNSGNDSGNAERGSHANGDGVDTDSSTILSPRLSFRKMLSAASPRRSKRDAHSGSAGRS